METFWALTPHELAATVEAASWRLEQDQRRDLALAWHIAALSRAKKLPSLRRLLGSGKARRLQGAELERRRREHEEIVRRLDGRRE